MHRSMMQVYVVGSRQAVEYYQDALGAKLVCRHENNDGTIAHAELDVYGQIMAISESPEKEIATGNTMQFCLHFGEGKEETVREITNKLSDGCKIFYSGSIEWSPLMSDFIDKFGVRWCIFV